MPAPNLPINTHTESQIVICILSSESYSEVGANVTLAHQALCWSIGVRRIGARRSRGVDLYLTFEYVEDPFCDGGCISGDGSAVADRRYKREVGEVEKRRFEGGRIGSAEGRW